MNLIKLLTLYIFIVFGAYANSYAQQQVNWNWYFGTNCALNFSTGNPVAVAGGVLNTIEGCASVSDAVGNLLFYTDGIAVWNSYNIQMPNGFGLHGHPSSTQSALIVPKPDSGSIYYVFTSTCCGGSDGICYSEVDTSLDAGLGDVTVKNVQLLTPATEKLVAVRNCNNNEYWVIGHGFNNAKYYAWSVTSAGVGAPVISTAGTVYDNYIGYLKVSPNGHKIASAVYAQDLVDLLDFDNSTGVVSNLNPIEISVAVGAYGLSFSPNSSVLYEIEGEDPAHLAQWDLSSNNQTTINASHYAITTQYTYGGALQLGTDNKLYVCNDGSSYLDAVDNPNVVGVGCNFVADAVLLTGTCQNGLPNLIDALGASPPVSENINITTCLNAYVLSPSATGTSYLWSTGATTDSITVTTDSTYWVHVIDATACNQTVNIADTFNVTFAPHPVVDLGLNHSVCGTGPDTLNVNDQGDTYLWNTGSTTDSIIIHSTGTYHITVSNGGCTTTDSVTVTFVAVPTVYLGPDTTICSTDSITLNAGNTGFHFLWNTGATTQTITIDTAGNYSVYISENTCYGTDTVQISVLTPPVVNIGPDTSICSNQSVTLNAGNTGSSFIWSTGATTQSITANTSGTFWVLVSNATCSNNDTAVITVIQMPVVNLGSDTILCIGESITIDAGNTGYYYNWNTGATTQAINVTTAGHYWVVVNQQRCEASDTILISFIPPPVINLGNDTIVCSPNPVTLHAQNIGNTYLWNTGQTSDAITVNNPGIYWVIVNNGSCVRADSITISVVTPPVLTAQFSADTTSGCDPLTINFINTSSGGTSFSWNYGDSTTIGTSANPTHTFTDTGVFTVTLMMVNDTSTACGNFYDTLVIPTYIAVGNPVHITSKFSGSPFSGCTPLTVNLINSSINGTNYVWNFGNGMSDSDTGNITMTYFFPGIYTITLIASNPNARCYNPPDSMSLEINVENCELSIPNIFSPNGDGKNDFFNLIADGYTNFHLIIFDRWGLKIFETSNTSNQWNGKVNNTGGDCPDGTYYYIFSANDLSGSPFSMKGFITLIR